MTQNIFACNLGGGKLLYDKDVLQYSDYINKILFKPVIQNFNLKNTVYIS